MDSDDLELIQRRVDREAYLLRMIVLARPANAAQRIHPLVVSITINYMKLGR